MNVLYISDIPFWGGSTLSMKTMIDSLCSNIKPIILVSEEGDISRYARSSNIECVVLSYPTDFFKAPRYAFIPFYIFAKFRYEYKKKHFLRTISLKLKNRKIAIVHSNTSAIDIGYDVAKLLKAKHVWHVREMLDTFNYIHFINGLANLKDKMAKSDGIIFISNACKSHWDVNSAANRQMVIGDAVRRKSDIVNIKEKKKYFLFVSVWLSEFKGTDLAIKAFALSGLSARGYRLKLIGKYKEVYRKQLEFLSRELDVYNYVDFVGLLDAKEVKQYIVEATAFLQCSKIEGLGRVSIEAMFYGCPVIARNCGGTLDFVKNGKSGFLWNTTCECAEMMKYVVSHDMGKIVKTSQEIVTANYSIEGYGNKILEVYNCL